MNFRSLLCLVSISVGLAQAKSDADARARALDHARYGNIPLYAGRLAAVGGLAMIFLGSNTTVHGWGSAAYLASGPLVGFGSGMQNEAALALDSNYRSAPRAWAWGLSAGALALGAYSLHQLYQVSGEDYGPAYLFMGAIHMQAISLVRFEILAGRSRRAIRGVEAKEISLAPLLGAPGGPQGLQLACRF